MKKKGNQDQWVNFINPFLPPDLHLIQQQQEQNGRRGADALTLAGPSAADLFNAHQPPVRLSHSAPGGIVASSHPTMSAEEVLEKRREAARAKRRAKQQQRASLAIQGSVPKPPATSTNGQVAGTNVTNSVAKKINRFEAGPPPPPEPPAKTVVPEPTKSISAKAAKINQEIAKESHQASDGEGKLEFTKAEKKKILRQLESWPAASAFVEPIKVGYLKKRKGKKNGWKKRYMLLHDKHLLYYNKPTDPHPLGAILLDGTTVNTVTEFSKKFCFSIYHPVRRVFFFQTQSEEELNEWKSLITRQIESLTHLKHLKTVVGEESDEAAPDTNDPTALGPPPPPLPPKISKYGNPMMGIAVMGPAPSSLASQLKAGKVTLKRNSKINDIESKAVQFNAPSPVSEKKTAQIQRASRMGYGDIPESFATVEQSPPVKTAIETATVQRYSSSPPMRTAASYNPSPDEWIAMIEEIPAPQPQRAVVQIQSAPIQRATSIDPYNYDWNNFDNSIQSAMTDLDAFVNTRHY